MNIVRRETIDADRNSGFPDVEPVTIHLETDRQQTPRGRKRLVGVLAVAGVALAAGIVGAGLGGGDDVVADSADSAPSATPRAVAAASAPPPVVPTPSAAPPEVRSADLEAIEARLALVEADRAELQQKLDQAEVRIAHLTTEPAGSTPRPQPFEPSDHLQEPISSTIIDGVEFRLEKLTRSRGSIIFEFVVLSPDRDAEVKLAQTVRVIDENGQEFKARTTSLAPKHPKTSGDVEMDLIAGIPMRPRVLVGQLGDSDVANVARFSLQIDGATNTLELRGIRLKQGETR